MRDPSTSALRAFAQDDGGSRVQSPPATATSRTPPATATGRTPPATATGRTPPATATSRTPPVILSGAPRSGAQSKDLRAAAEQLESVFVEQLFKAMRATVPQGEGIVTASSGEELFTSLMDQHLAAETPAQWSSGIADALYRQLLPRIAPQEPNSSTP